MDKPFFWRVAAALTRCRPGDQRRSPTSDSHR